MQAVFEARRLLQVQPDAGLVGGMDRCKDAKMGRGRGKLASFPCFFLLDLSYRVLPSMSWSCISS